MRAVKVELACDNSRMVLSVDANWDSRERFSDVSLSTVSCKVWVSSSLSKTLTMGKKLSTGGKELTK